MDKKIKLNLGCGVGLHKGYVNVDKYIDLKKLKTGAKTKKGVYKNAHYEKGIKFVEADILQMPFPDEYADVVELHQVIEHFNIRNIVPLLIEIKRVMKKGARLIITAPSFSSLAKEWVENDWKEEWLNKNGAYDLDEYFNLTEQIYGNQVEGIGETHLCPITPRFLQCCLTSAGFTDIIVWINLKGSRPIKGLGLASKTKKGMVCRCDTICAIVKNGV